MDKVRPDAHVLGIAAVDVASRGFELGAEILLSGEAILAMTTGGGDPGDADASTRSNDLSRFDLLLAAGASRPAVSLLIPDLTGRRGREKDVKVDLSGHSVKEYEYRRISRFVR